MEIGSITQRLTLTLAMLHAVAAGDAARAQSPSSSALGTCVATVPADGLQTRFDHKANASDAGHTLQGDVRLDYQGMTLCAAKLTFTKSPLTLIGSGGVALRDRSGNVTRAERIILADDFARAYATSFGAQP